MKKKPKTLSWHEVYHQLALSLKRFYERHKEKSGRSLFNLLMRSPEFKRNNRWLLNVKESISSSVDPIQLFASFNRSRQDDKQRIAIIKSLAKLLTSKKRSFDVIDFQGCPTPVAFKIQHVREKSEQVRIWYWFNEIMTNGPQVLSSSLWSEMKKWSGIQVPAFTIFLFWIDSRNFMPLDRNTRQYLEAGGLLLPKSELSLEKYKSLLTNQRIKKQYMQLSLEARDFSYNFKTFDRKYRETLLSPTNVQSGFRLIGLRTLRKNKNVHKVLQANYYYPLDNTIRPQGEGEDNGQNFDEFYYQPAGGDDLHDLDDLKVKITAIVGKNGSGKSTLLDLVLMGIYNLSIQLGHLNRNKYRQIGNLNFEIYWQTDSLYKIKFGKEILVYKFRQEAIDGKVFYRLPASPISLKAVSPNFFYSILVNYSHYALNSTEYKTDWITPLTHKNDGYSTPLVISPQRTKGDIDINREKSLLNMRLMINFIELHDADLQQRSFRYIDNDKYVKYFSVEFDQRKADEKREEAQKQLKGNKWVAQIILEEINQVFMPEGRSSRIPYGEEIDHYLINKLLSIVSHYQPYVGKYKRSLLGMLNTRAVETQQREREIRALINTILNEIRSDATHVTLKLKQAVNYLKYASVRKILMGKIKNEQLIPLDEYGKMCIGLVNREKNLTEAELMPPALFKLEFYVNDSDKSSVNKASSGEFQVLSVLSSIIYHIRNIDSLENGYRYIAVLLDEIELYFHPNMQRLFIRKLLEAMAKLDTNLYGIHIVFSTHSPFILSDIQHRNILRLKLGKVEGAAAENKTFAANIHDLLADEFFLNDSSMGAFAKNKIEIIINLLHYTKAVNDLNSPDSDDFGGSRKLARQRHLNEIKMYEKKLQSLGFPLTRIRRADIDREHWRQTIELIGEPLIEEKLRGMYNDAFRAKSDLAEREKAKAAILELMKKNKINLTDL